ncbi:MAG TPA: helicase [Bacteroidales bacterium]|nr:helicase [Bacteroidales bacterium]
MQIKTFIIPIFDNGTFQDEVNSFLRTHKVIEIEKQLIKNEKSCYWSIFITYLEGTKPGNEQFPAKKDYRLLLNEEEFARFSKLRVVRKQIAATDGLQVFMVFTEEELFEIAKLKEVNKSNLLTIKGIGDKKIEKFADRIIAALNNENLGTN